MNELALQKGHIVSLDRLPLGMAGEVCGTAPDHTETSFTERAMEMGLVEGTRVEVTHHAPFGGAIAVRCRGALIALRKDNARWIRVRVL